MTTPKQCEHAREWLGLRVDGELDAERRIQLEEHLRDCAACREVESWMARVDRLAAAENDPGVTVAHLAELEERILYSLPSAQRRPWWRRFALPTLVPSAALALFLFLFLRETPIEEIAEPTSFPQEDLRAPLLRTPEVDEARNDAGQVEEFKRESAVDAPSLQRVQGDDADRVSDRPVTPSPAITQGFESVEVAESHELPSSEAEGIASAKLAGDAVLNESESESSEAFADYASDTVDDAGRRGVESPTLLQQMRAFRSAPDANGARLLLARLTEPESPEVEFRQLAKTQRPAPQAEESAARTLSLGRSADGEDRALDAMDSLKLRLELWLAAPERSAADSLLLREAQLLLESLN